MEIKDVVIVKGEDGNFSVKYQRRSFKAQAKDTIEEIWKELEMIDLDIDNSGFGNLTCGHCGYNWRYRGKAEFYATCPKCHYIVKII